MNLSKVQMDVLEWIEAEPGIKPTTILNRSTGYIYNKNNLRCAIWDLLDKGLVNLNNQFGLYRIRGESK